MDMRSEIINRLPYKRDQAFVQKFYIEQKPDNVIVDELYLENMQTLYRIKKRVRVVVAGYQKEKSSTFFIG